MDVSLPSRGPLYDDKPKALFCFVPTRHFLQLRACLMRPYHGKYLELKKKCVNSCLLRVCLVIESVFGIMSQRVRFIFVMPIAVRTDLADLIVLASCCLHNFFMSNFTLILL